MLPDIAIGVVVIIKFGVRFWGNVNMRRKGNIFGLTAS
jgi:hypothetical protein